MSRKGRKKYNLRKRVAPPAAAARASATSPSRTEGGDDGGVAATKRSNSREGGCMSSIFPQTIRFTFSGEACKKLALIHDFTVKEKISNPFCSFDLTVREDNQQMSSHIWSSTLRDYRQVVLCRQNELRQGSHQGAKKSTPVECWVLKVENPLVGIVDDNQEGKNIICYLENVDHDNYPPRCREKWFYNLDAKFVKFLDGDEAHPKVEYISLGDKINPKVEYILAESPNWHKRAESLDWTIDSSIAIAPSGSNIISVYQNLAHVGPEILHRVAGIKKFSEQIAKCVVPFYEIFQYVFDRERWVHAHAKGMRVRLGEVIDSIEDGMKGIATQLVMVRYHLSLIEIDED